MVTLLHFSDVHLTVPRLGWRRRDWFSKKMLGWMNVKMLGRGRRFKHSCRVATEMIAQAMQAKYDGWLFTGDATKLAFGPEFQQAAHILGVGKTDSPPVIAVPGNHDYYTRRDAGSGMFEQAFGPWLEGERVDEHRYPYARKIGHVWIIVLNTSNPHGWNATASAVAGEDQLARLTTLCQRLDPGPRILSTHYPLRDGRGKVERRSHRLLDHKACLEAATACGIGLWIHGHIHKPFVLPASAVIPFPLVCVGSATQTKRWSHNIYEIDGYELKMTRRTWNPQRSDFDVSHVQELTLRTETEAVQQ
jgi:3',5'-cyclic AMP phosphodiesterase CpdA